MTSTFGLRLCATLPMSAAYVRALGYVLNTCRNNMICMICMERDGEKYVSRIARRRRYQEETIRKFELRANHTNMQAMVVGRQAGSQELTGSNS
jgi:hypothetical protein